MPNVLLLHGNGGSRTRFVPLLKSLLPKRPELDLRIPRLSGFDGRPIPKEADHWTLFMQEIEEIVADKLDEPWILYGHGIGGSLLLELAGRDYTFPSGQRLDATQVILHAPIGATLKLRRFPALMKPPIMRRLGKWLLTRKILRSRWEKRLFQAPEEIPDYLREQFFLDYTQCDAFGVFFDLITPEWYEQLQPRIQNEAFRFVWGEEERVVQSDYAKVWQADFPQASLQLIPGWDHFPMLEQLEEFEAQFLQWIDHE